MSLLFEKSPGYKGLNTFECYIICVFPVLFNNYNHFLNKCIMTVENFMVGEDLDVWYSELTTVVRI